MGHLWQNIHIISVHVGRYKCSSTRQIACNVQILPLGEIYSTMSHSAGYASIFRGLLLKGNMEEKGFRGTPLQQQGNTATIWDTMALSQFSTVYQLRTVSLPTDLPVLYCNKLQQTENYIMLPTVIFSSFCEIQYMVAKKKKNSYNIQNYLRHTDELNNFGVEIISVSCTMTTQGQSCQHVSSWNHKKYITIRYTSGKL